MKTTLRTMTVAELIDLDSKGMLKIDSEYQRAAEWTLKQERLLIDSLLRGYPLPMFYLHKRVTESTWATNTNFYIIDGQQRKNAIVRFVKNQFAMFDLGRDKKTGLALFQRREDISWQGKTFNALDETNRKQLLNTSLSVVEVDTVSDNEVRDLFIRLQGGLPLSAQEKRDAWPGDFTKFIIETAGKKTAGNNWTGHDFFKRVLKGTSTRGNMRKTCASLFMQSFSRNKGAYSPDSFTSTNALEIDNFYQYHIDFNSLSDESHAPRFRAILDEATDLLGDDRTPKLETHMAYNVVLFFDVMMDKFAPDWRTKFVEAFHQFQEKLVVARKHKDSQDEFWAQYGVFTGVSASSKATAEARYRFFEEKMLEYMPNLMVLDTQRGYRASERELVYYRDKRTCYKCGHEVKWVDAEIDHNTPHALGGQTTLENALLVHNYCHTRGVNALTESKPQLDEVLSDKPWEEDLNSEDKQLVLTPDGKRVTFSDLANSGLISKGCTLVYHTKKCTVEATFHPPKSFIYENNGESKEYSSFSNLVFEKTNSHDIWNKGEVIFPDGEVKVLGDIRYAYIQSLAYVDEDEE